MEALREESARGTLILVEGKKDVEAMQTLGVGGSFVTVKTGGKSLADTLQEIEGSGAREIILLLDFDERGTEMTLKLKQYLERERIKPNTHFWMSLQRVLGKEVRCIESITAYLLTLRRKLE